jgi:hypothetical protein
VVAHKESKTSGYIYEKHDGTKSDRAYPDQTAALKAMKQEVADNKETLKDILDKKQSGEKLAPHELLMHKTLTTAEPGKKSTLDLLEAEGYKPKGETKEAPKSATEQVTERRKELIKEIKPKVVPQKFGSDTAQKRIQIALNSPEVQALMQKLNVPTAEIVSASLRGVADMADHGRIRQSTGEYMNKVIKDNPGFDAKAGRAVTMKVNELVTGSAFKTVADKVEKLEKKLDPIKDHPGYSNVEKIAKKNDMSVRPWTPGSGGNLKRIYLKRDNLDVGYVEQKKPNTAWEFMPVTKRSTMSSQELRESLGQPIADAMNKEEKLAPKEEPKKVSTSEKALKDAEKKFEEAQNRHRTKALFGTPEEKAETAKVLEQAKADYQRLRNLS